MMINDGIEKSLARSKVERDEDWRGFCNKSPFLSFPEGYEFSVIPPFGGAKARMIVRKVGGESSVSVYLDDNCSLGHYCDKDGNPKPYWEIYPAEGGDTGRFDIEDTKELVAAIVLSLTTYDQEKARG